MLSSLIWPQWRFRCVIRCFLMISFDGKVTYDSSQMLMDRVLEKSRPVQSLRSARYNGIASMNPPLAVSVSLPLISSCSRSACSPHILDYRKLFNFWWDPYSCGKSDIPLRQVTSSLVTFRRSIESWSILAPYKSQRYLCNRRCAAADTLLTVLKN
jgi:hypothetical protein